jgi:hypothetical protein
MSALLLGVLIWQTIGLILNFVIPLLPASVRQSMSEVTMPRSLEIILRVVLDWNPLWYFLLGAPYASLLSKWIVAGWPNIDFDFGPLSTRDAATRRNRLIAFWAVVIAPLLVAILVEVLKGAWQSSK